MPSWQEMSFKRTSSQIQDVLVKVWYINAVLFAVFNRRSSNICSAQHNKCHTWKCIYHIVFPPSKTVYVCTRKRQNGIWMYRTIMQLSFQLALNCIIIFRRQSQKMTTHLQQKVTWIYLTHWGRVTQICVSKLTIGSDNGLSPGRRQAIIWTNDGILLIRTFQTHFSEMVSKIHTFSFKKMHFKMSPGKWWPSCLGPNELIRLLRKDIQACHYI